VRAEDRVAPGGARDPSAPAARDQRVCRAPDADVSREFGARICPTGDRGEWDAADGLENDGLNASKHLELGTTCTATRGCHAFLTSQRRDGAFRDPRDALARTRRRRASRRRRWPPPSRRLRRPAPRALATPLEPPPRRARARGASRARRRRSRDAAGRSRRSRAAGAPARARRPRRDARAKTRPTRTRPEGDAPAPTNPPIPPNPTSPPATTLVRPATATTRRPPRRIPIP